MSTPMHSSVQERATNEIPFTDTVTRSAQRTGLSEWTIRQLVYQGKVKARYFGKRVLVVQQSLIEFVESLPDER